MITATPPQYMRALEKANEVKRRHGEIRRQIRQGDLTVAEALREHDDEIDGMKLTYLLQAQTRVGEQKTRRALAMIGASRAVRVRDLTDRQRNLLCQFTEGRI